MWIIGGENGLALSETSCGNQNAVLAGVCHDKKTKYDECLNL